MKRATFFIWMAVVLLGCQARPGFIKPALNTEGELFVYLAPIPQNADRLTFRLEAISALLESGETIPLSLMLERIDRKEGQRERFLASGRLPPGRYAGLVIRAKDASLKGEEGEAALQIPPCGSRLAVPFTVTGKRGMLLVLSFQYEESIPGGFQFIPSFHAIEPGRIATGLVSFVSSRRGNTVTMYDKVSGRVVRVIPTGQGPAGMALDPRRRKLFVAVSDEDLVEVVDILAGEVTERLRLRPGDNPVELALTPDGNRLISVNTGSNTVSFIHPVSLMEDVRIPVGNAPGAILMDPNGRRAYVFNTLSNNITILDIPGQRVAATIATEASPVRGEFNRDGSRLYVAHRSSPFLAVIDPFTFSLIKRFYVGTGAAALKVDSRTDRIYLARQHTGQVEVFDPFSSIPVDFIRVGEDVANIAIDGEEKTLLLVLPETGTVQVIRLVGKGIVRRIDVGEDPYWVTLMGDR